MTNARNWQFELLLAIVFIDAMCFAPHASARGGPLHLFK